MWSITIFIRLIIIMKTIATIIIAILVIDFVCFWFWIFSGQTPADNFYAGAITANIIRLIIKLL